MGLRAKLLLPTLVIVSVFTVVVHFFWVPTMVEDAREMFVDHQHDVIRALESNLARDLAADDLAAVHATLDNQLEIHKGHWQQLVLKNANNEQLYPLFKSDTLNADHLLSHEHKIFWQGEHIASLQLTMNLTDPINQYWQRFREFEWLGLILFSMMLAIGLIWQNIFIREPLSHLLLAANRLAKGDFKSQLPDPSQDEVGRLTHAFDIMRKNLIQIHDDLEVRVQERTAKVKEQAVVIDQIHDSIVTTDLDGIINSWNQGSVRMLGYSAEEAIGKPATFMYPKEEHLLLLEQIIPLLKEQDMYETEVMMQRKDGGIFFAHQSLDILKNSSNQPKGIIYYSIDVTAHKKADQQLLLAKEVAEAANQAKSDFLANMSHELRTPMHAILSYANLGIEKHETAPKEKIHRYFSRIDESGERLLALLNNLLDLSKLEAGRMDFNIEEHNLKDLVNIIKTELEELLNNKSLSLKTAQTKIDTTAYFDTEKMLQVVRNLISNAIKFTPENNAIIISFEETELSINLDEDDDNIILPAISLTVTDEGIGIPEDELDIVFDKFVQSSKTKTGAGGTGLGLAISKEIITSHNGTIQAKNSPQGGAAFTFTIPRQMPGINRQ